MAVLRGQALVIAGAVFFVALAARADVQPGDVISKANIEKVKDLVSPGVEWCLQHGMTMKIKAPREVKLPKRYVEATEKYAGQVKLGAERLEDRELRCRHAFSHHRSQ